MSKYGRQHRDRGRREIKRQSEAFEEPAAWEPDPNLETHEAQETDYPGNRLVSQRVVKYVQSNQIVQFAVVVKELSSSGDWVELLCIDTCNHGTVHRHLDGDHTDANRQDISQIDSQAVVQNGFWDAIEEAYDLAYGEGNG